MNKINWIHASIMLAIGFVVGGLSSYVIFLGMPDTWDVASRGQEIRRKHLILDRLMTGQPGVAAQQLATEINSEIVHLDNAATTTFRLPGIGESIHGELRKVRNYRAEVKVDYGGISTNAIFQQTLARTENALLKYQ